MASCVRVADPALAAEVTAHRALAALQLRPLADTVLASTKPIGETVAALRKAGYAPVRQDARGETVVERVPVRRAKAPGRPAGEAPAATGPDLRTLAAQLCRVAPTPEAEPAPLAEIDGSLSPEEVPLLEPAEVAVLAHAVRHRLPVLIDYVNAAGNRSTRVIEPRMRLFGTLVAWCREKQAERNFTLERITAVSPVEL